MAQARVGRPGLVILVALLVAGGLAGLVPAAAVRAADGYNISSMNQTQQQALGISVDGRKLCAVWTQFDVPRPQVYFRLYDAGAQSWSPPLNAAPFQVSTTGDTNKPRCAIDRRGAVHVVWQQKTSGRLDVAHRLLFAGADPANGGSWSGVSVLAENRSSADIDVFEPAPDGKVWLVYRRFVEGASSELQVRSWSADGGWGDPRTIAPGGGADEPRIGVDNNGFVHILFRNGGASGHSYVSLDPNGNFGQQLSVPNATGAGATDIAVDRGNGDVHVVYVKEFTKVFYAKKSYNSGFSLNQLATGSQQVDDPSIAWSANGRIQIIYNNNKGAEIDLWTSDDQGNNWRGPEVLASPSGGVSTPWIVADPGGVGYVVYNRRNESAVYFTSTAGAAPTPEPPAPAPPTTTPATAAAPITDGRHEYFTQTGHNLGNAFREYWHAQGGLLRFGYPLTEEFVERSPDDGRDYTVQYFERARFEWHPENAPPFNVLLGRLGLRLRPLDPPVAALPGAAYFPETGHNLGGAFLAYWQQNGGLAVFGYPTSEEFTEVSPTDGRPYTVQYFERNRFEYHPENEGTPYNVLLGLLGRQELVDRGWLR